MSTKKTAAKKTAAKKTAPPAPKMKQAALRRPRPPKTKSTGFKEGGLVLPDPGFHLAVMGALLEMGKLHTQDITAALVGVEGDGESERLAEGLARLHRRALNPAEVATIESLDFDGGNQIYMALEEGCGAETGGESDDYEARSIEGIGALTSLVSLRLDGHGYQISDLKPLAGHPNLADLRLSSKCKVAKVLETLPKLARLDARWAKLSRAGRSGAEPVSGAGALDRLAKKGVEILRPEE